MENLRVIVLAAGQGTRMKSATVKVLHPLLGRPLIAWVLEAAGALKPEAVIVVTGRQAEAVEAACRSAAPELPLRFVLQKEQRGTGDAVLAALPEFATHDGPLLILAGDVPGISIQALKNGATIFATAHPGAVLFTAELEYPHGYGRIVRDDAGQWAGIVEEKDATGDQRLIREVNAGIYLADAAALRAALPKLTANNAQKELYLTDAFKLIREAGKPVALCMVRDAAEVAGINDRAQLAQAAARLQKMKLHELMLAGVTVADPVRTTIDHCVAVGADSVLHPGVCLYGKTVIAENCEIRAGAVLRDCTIGAGTIIHEYSVLEGASVGRDCRIGPFARVRPESSLADGVHLGNFVETKKASFGPGSKANHLSYLGDAKIGAGVNIGAGTITCNYDGVNKHLTTIEDGVFVGSNSSIVAPRTLGARSVIGAGSVVRSDVPADSLYVTTGEKKEIKNHPVVKAIAAKRAKKKSN